ncbi:hypothetical protein EDD17DRAFT_1551690 [Pisolithus thermaeus]|nr:hypothetical protein EV401DRAFT_1962143 [Pisolithus croceorrhizus]KAI6165601.1 hypothetical protein EDD17DRAFT_1551690 [Pisolithus thermaeus]
MIFCQVSVFWMQFDFTTQEIRGCHSVVVQDVAVSSSTLQSVSGAADKPLLAKCPRISRSLYSTLAKCVIGPTSAILPCQPCPHSGPHSVSFFSKLVAQFEVQSCHLRMVGSTAVFSLLVQTWTTLLHRNGKPWCRHLAYHPKGRRFPKTTYRFHQEGMSPVTRHFNGQESHRTSPSTRRGGEGRGKAR